jgi:glucose/arabinose dehydrogenase
MSTSMRRCIIIGMALAAGVLAAQVAGAQTTAIPKGNIEVNLELVCDGFTSPVTATHAGDRSGRLFIVDQAGTIRILDQKWGRCLDEPFLDLTDRIVEVNPAFDERGVLGLAFHPRFKRNGRFYVRYSAPREGSAGEPCFGTPRGCHEAILSEFRVRYRYADEADPASERILFRIDEPQFNHNSGHVAFGSDGYLYFTLGDGGGAHDGLAESPPLHGPIGNGQNIETVLGSILRIDVDRRDAGLEYRIPRSNPFYGDTPGADEIYAYGMRNPYRFSFDRGNRSNGRRRHHRRRTDLFLADVGQNLFEEINVVQKGGNYGWVIAEGFHCFDPLAPTEPPLSCPGMGPNGEPLLNPIAEYNHGDGLAVVGGFVYRGRKFPSLSGKYVFGDFSRSFFPGDGRLFWLDADGGRSDIFEFKIGEQDQPLGLYLFGFGEDERGELFVLTSQNLGPSGEGGQVWRLTVPGDRRGHHGDDDD